MGNLKRKTPRPTAECLLGAFRNITFYHHRDRSREITQGLIVIDSTTA